MLQQGAAAIPKHSLWQDSGDIGPVLMADLAPPARAIAAAAGRGHLQVGGDVALPMEILRDDHGLAAEPARELARLPVIAFDYQLTGHTLLPLQRGLQRSAHPHWDFLVEPGRAWREDSDGDTVRVSLPFALQEKNANCTHNGVLQLLLDPARGSSRALVLIASETCQYFKFNLQGLLPTVHRPTDADPGPALSRQRALQAAQLQVKPLSARLDPLPAVADLSARGLATGSTLYRAPCPTRRGDHPFCDALALPSYSLAKSLVAGLGLMRLEALYPGAKNRTVSELVPACAAAGGWEDVTLDDLLNMSSGHYTDSTPQADEDSPAMLSGLFLPADHARRIQFSCSGWPRREPPGRRFVYHTSDSYLLGTAMTRLLRHQQGPEADLYRDLLLPLWQALGLSPLLDDSRRSDNSSGQPLTGYGLTLRADDMARLALALLEGRLDGLLDTNMLHAALQPGTGGGLVTGQPGLTYRNGFWQYRAAGLAGCAAPLILPFLSGYGGISVVLLPGPQVYYQFGDGGDHRFRAVIESIHRQTPLCGADPQTHPQETT